MEVLPNGEIISLNEAGERLIDELALDAQKITEMRYRYIRTIKSLQKNDKKLFLMWMGFPKNMPDLAHVVPQPKHNTCPEGILKSWFHRNPLPEFYE
jgi:hypothetical protein